MSHVLKGTWPEAAHVALDVVFADERDTYFPIDKAAWVMNMLTDHFTAGAGPFADEYSPPIALVVGYGAELSASIVFPVPRGWTAEKFGQTVEFRFFEIFMQRNDVLIEEGFHIEEEAGVAQAYSVSPEDWASSFKERSGLFTMMFCDDDELGEKLAECTARPRKPKLQVAA